MRTALDDQPTGQRIADLGFDVPPPERRTPEALGSLRKAEKEELWPIIKAAGIKGE
jgi:hypothetical protein